MSYQCFRPSRSPYGIREPAVKPPIIPAKPNWMQSLLHYRQIMFPNKAELDEKRYIETSSAAQTVASGSSYETKLRADWQGGRRSDDITDLHGLSTGLRFPWPQGTDFGPPSDQQRWRDFAWRPPQGMRPVYKPATAPYGALKSSTPGVAWDPSAEFGGAGREDLIPIGGRQQMFRFTGKDVVRTVPSDPALGYGLDYGPAPWRVPYMRKSGLSLMAGPHQFGNQQQYSGVVGGSGARGSILIAPPVWGDVTRGSRGISGILQRVQGPGRSNVPGVFVPSEVR